MKLLLTSLKYSGLAVVGTLAYLFILMQTGGNTLVMQLLGMFIISLVAMFLIVRVYLHSEANPYTFVTAIKMGVAGGVSSGAILLCIESILLAAAGIHFAPDVMLNSGYPYITMQIMLAFGTTVFALISSFACFQFFKRPLEGSRYRKPKSWSTQEQH